MLIKKESRAGFVYVAEMLMNHGLEHYESFVFIENNKTVLPRIDGRLSSEEILQVVLSIIHFDNAAELYLKAFLLQNDYIINLPKKKWLKFTDKDNFDFIFLNRTLDFVNILDMSKKLILEEKRNEFSKGFKEMHNIRNELYHVGGMGESFLIYPEIFKSFIKSLKILFQTADWYTKKEFKPLLDKWEKTLNSDWTKIVI